MKKKSFVIKNKLGIHARPAALLAQLASKFNSKITMIKDGQEIDCKSILGIMTTAVGYGSSVEVIVEGIDEEHAIMEMEKLFENKFQEE